MRSSELPWIYLEIQECTPLCTSVFWLCFSETRKEGGQGRSPAASRRSTAAEVFWLLCFFWHYKRGPGDQKLLMGTRIGHCHAGMWSGSP